MEYIYLPYIAKDVTDIRFVSIQPGLTAEAVGWLLVVGASLALFTGYIVLLDVRVEKEL